MSVWEDVGVDKFTFIRQMSESLGARNLKTGMKDAYETISVDFKNISITTYL